MQEGKIDMMKRDAQLYRETTQVRYTSQLTSHTSHFSPHSCHPSLFLFKAKINELRGALADGRSDADTGTHSDGMPFGGDAMRSGSQNCCILPREERSGDTFVIVCNIRLFSFFLHLHHKFGTQDRAHGNAAASDPPPAATMPISSPLSSSSYDKHVL